MITGRLLGFACYTAQSRNALPSSEPQGGARSGSPVPALTCSATSTHACTRFFAFALRIGHGLASVHHTLSTLSLFLALTLSMILAQNISQFVNSLFELACFKRHWSLLFEKLFCYVFDLLKL